MLAWLLAQQHNSCPCAHTPFYPSDSRYQIFLPASRFIHSYPLYLRRSPDLHRAQSPYEVQDLLYCIEPRGLEHASTQALLLEALELHVGLQTCVCVSEWVAYDLHKSGRVGTSSDRMLAWSTWLPILVFAVVTCTSSHISLHLPCSIQAQASMMAENACVSYIQMHGPMMSYTPACAGGATAAAANT